MALALSTSALSKTYSNGFEALKTLDLQVEKGDFFALLGSNGAGKTTTLGRLAAYYRDPLIMRDLVAARTRRERRRSLGGNEPAHLRLQRHSRHLAARTDRDQTLRIRIGKQRAHRS